VPHWCVSEPGLRAATVLRLDAEVHGGRELRDAHLQYTRLQAAQNTRSDARDHGSERARWGARVASPAAARAPGCRPAAARSLPRAPPPAAEGGGPWASRAHGDGQMPGVRMACARRSVRACGRAGLLQQRRERASQCAVRPSLGDAGVPLGDLAGVLVALLKLHELYALLPQRALQRRQRDHRLPILSPPCTSCRGRLTLRLALAPPRSSSCGSCGRP